MRDQDFVLDAIEDAQRILAEHIEPGSHWNPEPSPCCYVCWTDAKSWLRSDGFAMGTDCAS